MMKEYGSYFPIELDKRIEYYRPENGYKVECFDCGRNAIVAIAKELHVKTLLIPYYNCDTVRDTLIRQGINIRYYFLDDFMLPTVDELHEGEWLLYVNYFGNTNDEELNHIYKQYKYVIFDNTQGFFTEPVKGEDCFNVYSPRKFVGVSDGAYVVWVGDFKFESKYETDVSWNRAAFLLKSIEVGTNGAYKDNIQSMENFGKNIKHMSVLTHRILSSINYKEIIEQRSENIKILHEYLKDINELPVDINVENNLMIYPFLTKKKELRSMLISKHIYISQWWKYLMEIVPKDSIEYTLSKWLLPLPVDQRYSREDIENMVGIVLDCYEYC